MTLLARSTPTRVTVSNFSIDLPMDGSPQMGSDNNHPGTFDAVGAPSTPSANLAHKADLAVQHQDSSYQNKAVHGAWILFDAPTNIRYVNVCCWYNRLRAR